MDTTKLEYELNDLRQRVEQLEADKATPNIDPDFVADLPRKPSIGHATIKLNKPPAPKFWTFWTAEPEKGEERNFCFYHHSSFDTPIYGFTREMLEAMLLQYQYVTMTVNYREFLNSYLKSNGGV